MEIEQPVTVDHGYLLEVLQSAEAWAGYLRTLARELPGAAVPQRTRYEQAADRIDQAISTIRKQSFGPPFPV